MENAPAATAVATHVMPGSGVHKRRYKPGTRAKIDSRQLNRGARCSDSLVEELLTRRMMRNVIKKKGGYLMDKQRRVYLGTGTVDIMRTLIEGRVGALFADAALLIRLHKPAHVEVDGRHIQFLIDQIKKPTPLELQARA